VETVAFNLDLSTVEALDGATGECQVLANEVGACRVAGTLDVRGIAAEIGEEEAAIGGVERRA